MHVANERGATPVCDYRGRRNPKGMVLISSRKAPQSPHMHADRKGGAKAKRDGESLHAAPPTFTPPYLKVATQAIQATGQVTANLAGHASRNGASLSPVAILTIT